MLFAVPRVINCPLSVTSESHVSWQNPRNSDKLSYGLASMKKITGTSQKPVLQFFTFPCIYQNPLQCNFSVTLLGGGASFTILWFWAGLGLSLVNRLRWKWWGDHSKPRPQRALLSVFSYPTSTIWTSLRCLLKGENPMKVSLFTLPEVMLDQLTANQASNLWENWPQTSSASYAYGQATQDSCLLVLCTSNAWPVPASPTPYSHERPSS